MDPIEHNNEILEDLAMRLFAALEAFSMGVKEMDKIYREISKRQGKINPKLLGLASYAMRVWGSLVEDNFSFMSEKKEDGTDDRNIKN